MFRCGGLSALSLRAASRRPNHLLLSSRPFSSTPMVQGPLLNTIKYDHRQIEAYEPHIMNNKSADERTRYQNTFVWELARHSIGKEIVVYPAMEKHLNDGRDMAWKDRSQLQMIKEQLYKFQGLDANDPEFEPTFSSLYSTLMRHVKEEEEHDIPRLESKLDHDALLKLSNSFERTKLLTPTRSHPSAPNVPPFQTAAALLSAPIDKIADIFRKFPKEDGPML
ncbi:hypothetical protein F4805DRAFT_448915 [Annulohypoxylon moriforme]|nr:hypothetical protein F4805DRAFT_448915 [Annulohypoxylon moriforme]